MACFVVVRHNHETAIWCMSWKSVAYTLLKFHLINSWSDSLKKVCACDELSDSGQILLVERMCSV